MIAALTEGATVAKKQTPTPRREQLTPELLEAHAIELEKVAAKMRSRAEKIRHSNTKLVEVNGKGYRQRGMGLIKQYMDSMSVAFIRAGIPLGETTTT